MVPILQPTVFFLDMQAIMYMAALASVTLAKSITLSWCYKMIGGLQDIVMEGTDDKCVSTMISHFRLNLEETKVERTETKVTKPRQSITLSCFSLLLVLKLLLFIFDRICPV